MTEARWETRDSRLVFRRNVAVVYARKVLTLCCCASPSNHLTSMTTSKCPLFWVVLFFLRLRLFDFFFFFLPKSNRTDVTKLCEKIVLEFHKQAKFVNDGRIRSSQQSNGSAFSLRTGVSLIRGSISDSWLFCPLVLKIHNWNVGTSGENR